MARIQLKRYEDKRQRIIANQCIPGTILDLGYAQAPNRYIDRRYATGVDFNENNGEVRYARELQGDVCDLNKLVEQETFSNVIAGEIIEHLENPYNFLRSLKQHLCPGGRLILSTPNIVSWPVILFERTGSRRFFYTTEHKYYFSPRWVTRIIECSGYRLINSISVGLWAPIIVLPCPLTLSYQVVYVAESYGEE